MHCSGVIKINGGGCEIAKFEINGCDYIDEEEERDGRELE